MEYSVAPLLLGVARMLLSSASSPLLILSDDFTKNGPLILKFA